MAERPTPYSISVCALIALQSDPTSPLYHEVNPTTAVQHRLSLFLQQCVVVNAHPCTNNTDVASLNTTPSTSNVNNVGVRDIGWSLVNGMSLSRFFRQLQSIGGIALAKIVGDCIQMAAASVDSLMDLMESLRRAIAEGVVDGTSAHGVFLRKSCLGFDQLSFSSTALLFSNLQEEITSAMDALQNIDKDNNVDNEMYDNILNDSHSDRSTQWPLSASQIERALRKECFHLFEISNATEEEGETFEGMEVKLRRVLKHDPELPAAHFLRFLNCIKYGERVGALDALHQYFDCAIIQSNKHKSHDILQFAAILLASLHQSFGDTALAQLATDESVRVAQQSMDAVCVAFALGWIFSNEQQQAGGNSIYLSSVMDMSLDAGDLLKRCASRAMEGQLRQLAAGVNLSLTRYHLSGNSSTAEGFNSVESRSATMGLAQLAWNSVADASTDRPSNESADDGAIDRPTHMANFSNSRDVMETLARQKLLSAAIWSYFGHENLSGISSFLAIYCHADQMQMLSHDVITAIQNIARVTLYGSPSVLLSENFDGSVLEKYMARFESNNISSANVKSDCIYSAALSKLTSLWNLFRLPMDGVFLLGSTLILHEWAIRRGEIHQATAFGAALESYLHPRLANYWQVFLDVFSQKSLLLSRQGNFQASKELIEDMIKVAKENDLRTHRVSLLLQLSLIHLDENPDMFTSALPSLLECLSMTEKYEMHGLHATALSVLAQVHLRMRNPNRAIALLQASLPSMLQGEHVWYQGDAFLTLAKCRLQLAKSFDDKNGSPATAAASKKPKLIGLLRRAAKDLQKSQDFFQRCQDCVKLREVFYLQARVFNPIPGAQSQRDIASRAFVNISQHLQRADSPLPGNKGGILDCLSDRIALEAMTHREIPVMAN